MATEDKGKSKMHDMSFLMGVKPYGNIGPGRTAEEAAKGVVGKLKKKKAGSTADIAEGSTEESGQKANVDKMSKAIGDFVNR